MEENSNIIMNELLQQPVEELGLTIGQRLVAQKCHQAGDQLEFPIRQRLIDEIGQQPADQLNRPAHLQDGEEDNRGVVATGYSKTFGRSNLSVAGGRGTYNC